jgi:membrane protease YdiL (CAAX protease family)
MTDGRLVAPVRIALFILVALGAYFLASALGEWALAAVPRDTRMLVYPYLLVCALLGTHLFALRVLEFGKPWSAIGLGPAHASPSLLASGFFIGALAIGIPSLLLLLTHQLSFATAPPGSWWTAAMRATIFLLPAALIEELFLRGYIFATLRDRVGAKWTLIGTSIAFGLLHLDNPGATPESTLLVIVAGFFLGTIVLVTRSVYAAWMAHFAWNCVMAVGLHTAVSGIGMSAPNYQVIETGPDWLTGGAWGPEGGFAAGASMIVCTLLLFVRRLPEIKGTPYAHQKFDAQI